MLLRVSVWFVGRCLRRPVQGRVACDLVEGGIPGSEVPGSKVIGGNLAALKVGFFDKVGSFGAGWRLAGEIGGAEFLATHAHYWASSL